ncbi:MAG: hypothetical protein JXA03_11540 [Bacteroidales bacterium]|nr:hypothetical protein [Bacteroidales bacterium]
MMRKLFFSLGVVFILPAFFSAGLHSQISQGGLPPSFKCNISGEFEEIIFTPPDVYALEQEDVDNESMGIPYRNGVGITVNKSIDNSGTWEELPNGGKVWRLKLSSPGARGLALYYDHFRLPVGGELYLYNEYKDQVLGAYTFFNNSETGLFSNEYIQGSSVTLEYYQPVWTEELPVISISEMAYGYRGVSFLFGNSEDFGDSYWCQINVNCSPEGNNWQDEKRGVARILLKIGSGYYWCSGSLINNTNEDATPYFLTAAHCGEGASASDMNQWIFYFNYEASGCSNPPSSPPYNSITGASFRANDPSSGNSGSDFLLVRLNYNVPLYYNPYYNGWNRSNTASPSGVSIHHPAGDIKKISTYSSPAQSSTAWNGLPTHWRLSWSNTTNGRGIMEGGSSGSPMFDNNGRIVGDLTGGYTYNSCNTPSPAFYGKVWYSWDQNGSTSATRLKDWLDPGNTGVIYLNGYDPNQVAPPGCTTPVTPLNGATSVPVSTSLIWNTVSTATGYKIYFGTNNPPTNIENGTNLGSSTTYTPNPSLNYNTTYYWKIVPFNLSGDATGCATWTFTTLQGLPGCSSPVSPTQAQSGVSIYASLNWNAVTGATGYKLYFGTNNPPTNLINGTDLGNTTLYVPASPMNYSQVYYWRIAPYNANGTNNSCSVWNFTTENNPTVTTFPWMEPFVNWPPAGWNPGTGPYYWIQYGNFCAECPVKDMTLNTNAIMESPPLNITGLSSPRLTFEWSHLYNPSYPADILEVLVSTNGGGSWASLWIRAGAQLNSNDGATATAPGSFVEEQIDLSPYNTKGTILLRFKGYSGLGGDIFVNYVLVAEGPQVPACTTPLYPADGAVNIPVNATMAWNHVSGALGYKIFMGTDNPPTNMENGTDLGFINFFDPAGDLNNNQTYYWKIIPYNNGGDATGCGIWSYTTESGGIILSLKAFLEGPYTGPVMAADLNIGGVLPLSQPYNTVPWNYSGSEAVASIPNNDVVDWVLVEIRDATDAASATGQTKVAEKAAFILRDGSVTETDGQSHLQFNGLTLQHSLYAVVRHRNHIDIMSAAPLTASGGVYSYDFTLSAERVFGGVNGHKEVGPGVWGMTGADGDANSQVNNGDKNDIWAMEAGSGGYYVGDFNLDVQVNNGDKNDLWIPNTGMGGQVPELVPDETGTMHEQPENR